MDSGSPWVRHSEKNMALPDGSNRDRSNLTLFYGLQHGVNGPDGLRVYVLMRLNPYEQAFQMNQLLPFEQRPEDPFDF